jgi:hypothetical protein
VLRVRRFVGEEAAATGHEEPEGPDARLVGPGMKDLRQDPARHRQPYATDTRHGGSDDVLLCRCPPGRAGGTVRRVSSARHGRLPHRSAAIRRASRRVLRTRCGVLVSQRPVQRPRRVDHVVCSCAFGHAPRRARRVSRLRSQQALEQTMQAAALHRTCHPTSRPRMDRHRACSRRGSEEVMRHRQGSGRFASVGAHRVRAPGSPP